MSLPRVLLVTTELFPEFGYPTAGGGVRAQQLYRSLEEQGFPVSLALAKESAAGRDLPDWATQNLFIQSRLDGVIEQADPDVVLSESWECLSHRRFDDNRIYVADCPGPLVLENLLGTSGNFRADIHHKIRTLAMLDYVLVPTSRMKSYLMGFLTLAGWKPDDSHRLVDTPISLPEALPPKGTPSSDDGLKIFVGGVSWAWHRSSEWLVQLADLVQRAGKGTVFVRLGPHPLLASKSDETEAIPQEVRDHPCIQFSDLTDFDALVRDLSEMDLAIEWSPVHFEREIASPFRIVNYLWCGLPVILRPHLELSHSVDQYRAGWIVDDWKNLEDLLEKISTDRSILQERSEGARHLAHEKHVWPRAHERLFETLKNPIPREKNPSYLMHAATTFVEYETELEERRSAYDLMKEEFDKMTLRLSEVESDAEAYRGLRQKGLYRLWKKIVG